MATINFSYCMGQPHILGGKRLFSGLASVRNIDSVTTVTRHLPIVLAAVRQSASHLPLVSFCYGDGQLTTLYTSFNSAPEIEHCSLLSALILDVQRRKRKVSCKGIEKRAS